MLPLFHSGETEAGVTDRGQAAGWLSSWEGQPCPLGELASQ